MGDVGVMRVRSYFVTDVTDAVDAADVFNVACSGIRGSHGGGRLMLQYVFFVK